jgi:hypothetical protein
LDPSFLSLSRIRTALNPVGESETQDRRSRVITAVPGPSPPGFFYYCTAHALAAILWRRTTFPSVQLTPLHDYYTMETGDAAKAEHLCILVHGLWGKPLHLNHLKNTLSEQYPDGRLYVLVPNSNAEYLTYDGIELGAERITNEIEQKVEELEKQGAKLSKISVVGYSLGGLIARYAIGLLYKNGLFDKLQPTNFTTFATPHLGVRSPTTGYGGQVWNTLGAKTLSTSGAQMFLADNFRETGKPLLAVLAEANSIFINGLKQFKHKSVYANTMNDRSVPYFTSAISRVDQFVDPDAIDVNYLPGHLQNPSDPSKLVILDPTNPVSLRQSPEETRSLLERYTYMNQRTLGNIPFYAAITVLLPIGATFFLANAGIQTYRSAQRVRSHEEGKSGFSIERYRMPLVESAQAVQDRLTKTLSNEGTEQYLPTPPPEPASESSSSSEEEEKSLAREETAKEHSDFPVLALMPQQFSMIDNLNSVGLTKYPVHIQNVRHTHAAIVVRSNRESFWEGRVVVGHWAREFEL